MERFLSSAALLATLVAGPALALDQIVVLGTVKVGEITLSDVPAAVIDGDFPSEVLLGNSFLNRVEMRREGAMLELRKPR